MIQGGPLRGDQPRILVLTQVLPYPLDAGPKVRAYHVLRALAEGADVHLLSFVRPDDTPEALAHLRALCASVEGVPMRRSRARDALHLVRALVTGTSFIIGRDAVSAMSAAVAGACAAQAFDVVHADQLWMARYAAAAPVPHKVLDDHNAVFRVFERLAVGEPAWWKRALWRLEAKRIARFEAAQALSFDRVVFVSEADRAAVAAVATPEERAALEARSIVIPICVDTAATAPLEVRPDARRLTFLGTLFWPPNAEGVLWFADHVLPRVLEAAPDAVFTVIGKQPPAEVRSLVDRHPGSVEVLGYVEDVLPLLRETAVFVVPLLSGGGMRVKILDAWMWGLPVVSTTVGAEGIDVHDGSDIILADRPDEFAEAVIRLLTLPEERDRIGTAGRAVVEARYEASTVYAKLEHVYPQMSRFETVETDLDA